jgi:hypothetical protein
MLRCRNVVGDGQRNGRGCADARRRAGNRVERRFLTRTRSAVTADGATQGDKLTGDLERESIGKGE